MGASTLISAALHLAVVLFVVVSFSSSSLTPAPLVAVPVDLATPSEVTKVKAGQRDAKDEGPLAGKPEEATKQAVKEKAVKTPDKTASLEKPADKAKPAPRPEPKPETKAEVPKPQPKPEAPARKPEPPKEQPKAEMPAPPKAEAAKAPPPPAPKATQEFDSDRIAALLNKIPDATDAAEPVELAEETKPVHGQTTGTAMSMSVNEIDALRARIAQCWTPPPGGLGADDIVVRIRLKLNQDGTLEGYPTVTNSASSPFFQAAADSAVRAVFQCQPYMLPLEKYALWRDMILNFDPSQMYGSG